jgi:hypothetical protein
MSIPDHFPTSSGIRRVLNGRAARWVYVAIVLLLLGATTIARIYSLFLTRRIEAVISGLSKLRIDDTT